MGPVWSNARVLVLALCALAGGCGLGTAGVAAVAGSENAAEAQSRPVVTLLADDQDVSRAIPIPFQVVDADGDAVELVFQWRRATQSFDEPPLDLHRKTPAEIRAVLADPLERERAQVMTEFGNVAEGRLSSTFDPASPELVELGSDASHLATQGIAGATLSVLRSWKRPLPIEPQNGRFELVSPAFVRATSRSSVLVLDSFGGAARLREVDLATGEGLSERTFSGGLPQALAHEPGQSDAVVLTDDGHFYVVDLDALEDVYKLASDVPSGVGGMARAGSDLVLLSLPQSNALATVFLDSELPQLDVQSHRVVSVNWSSPGGIVRNPTLPDEFFVANEMANELVTFNLRTRERRPIGTIGLTAPRDVAFDVTSNELLVSTSTDLRSLRLGTSDYCSVVGSEARVLASESFSSVSCGPDGFRVAIQSDPTAGDRFAVAGGVEQGALVVGYDAMRRRAVLAEPLASVPYDTSGGGAVNLGWRLRSTIPRPFPANSAGKSGVFVWDSSDVEGGLVQTRAFAMDGAVGDPTQFEATIDVERGLNAQPEFLAPMSVNGTFGLEGADFDFDGDLDFALLESARCGSGSDQIHVLRQERDQAGTDYDVSTPVTVEPTLNGRLESDIRELRVTDFDVDGVFDLAMLAAPKPPLAPGALQKEDLADCANSPAPERFFDPGVPGEDDVLIFLGEGIEPLLFSTQPLRCSQAMNVIANRIAAPQTLAVGDMDGDGKPDALIANEGTENVSIFGVLGRTQPVFLGETVIDDPSNPGSPSPCASVPDPPDEPPQGACTRPYSLAVGDIDLDGELDFVVGTRGEGDSQRGQDRDSVLVYLHSGRDDDGLLTFEKISRLRPLGQSPELRIVRLVDLDADGHLDVVVRALGGACVYLQDPRFETTGPNDRFPGLGFTIQDNPERLAPVAQLAGNNSRGIEFADIDLDGDQDVVQLTPAESFIEITTQGADLFGVVPPADGELIPVGGTDVAPDVAVGGSVTHPDLRDLVLADVDGDGRVDVTTAHARVPHNVMQIRQRTPFGFPTQEGISVPPQVKHGTPSRAETADFDGDGDLDIAVADASTFERSVAIYFQIRPRDFGLAGSASIGTSPAMFRPTDLAAGDFDGDGRMDLVTANAGDEVNSTPEHCTVDPGEEACREENLLFLSGAGTNPGAPDPENRTIPSQNLTLLRGGAGLVLEPGAVLTPPLEADGSGQLDVADAFDPDADDPFFLPVAVQAADFDGDGRLDVVAAVRRPMGWVDEDEGEFVAVNGRFARKPGQDAVAVYRVSASLAVSDSTASAPPAVLGDLPLGAFPTDLELGDADGDGDLDAFVTNEVDRSLSILVNDSSSGLVAFGTRTDVSFEGLAESLPRSLALGDLDGDGDLDVVVGLRRETGGQTAGELVAVVHESGGFSVDHDVFEPGFARNVRHVELGDIDRDGDLDAMSVNGVDGVRLFEQLVDGRFVPLPGPKINQLQDATLFDRPEHGLLRDLDGDFDLDIAIVSRNGVAKGAVTCFYAP